MEGAGFSSETFLTLGFILCKIKSGGRDVQIYISREESFKESGTLSSMLSLPPYIFL
jgi:hypothetical protein